MAIAVSSFGTLFKIGDGGGGGEVFTTVAEVKDIAGPKYAVGITDVTAHDTGPYHQKITSLIDAGQFTFDLNFNNGATQGFSGGIYNDMVNRTKRNFQLVIPTTVVKTGSFAGFVVGYEMAFPVDGAITASVTIEITGAVTWA